jgi:copper(I)-binding protein
MQTMNIGPYGGTFFESIELHRLVVTKGLTSMVPQDYMSVPTAGFQELKPGDYHLMLIHPAITLSAGDEVSVRLEFDNGNTLSVIIRVRKVSGEDHHPHDHHKYSRLKTISYS